MSTQSRLPNVIGDLAHRRNDKRLDRNYWGEGSWSHTCPMVSSMVAEQAGVCMMKEYFKIEVSKSTPLYGFRKGLKFFGDEGCQVAKNELKVNLLGRGCNDMLSWKDIMWDIRKQALGYLMFIKRKRSRRMKGKKCANGRPQQEYITKEESSSPTVSLYALMGSCLMDAMDNRKMIIINLPNVLLQGDWPHNKHPEYIIFEKSWWI